MSKFIKITSTRWDSTMQVSKTKAPDDQGCDLLRDGHPHINHIMIHYST